MSQFVSWVIGVSAAPSSLGERFAPAHWGALKELEIQVLVDRFRDVSRYISWKLRGPSGPKPAHNNFG